MIDNGPTVLSPRRLAFGRSDFSAHVLVLSLMAVFPCWLIGLEQFIPPLLLITGLVILAASGQPFRVPATAVLFLAFILISLASVAGLSNARAGVIFARGHFNLAAALSALVLTTNACTDRAGFKRTTQGLVVFTLILVVMSGLCAFGWIPAEFESVMAKVVDSSVLESSFFQEHILTRRAVRWEEPVAGVRVPRVSAVFFYPTLLAAALLPLLTVSLVGSMTLRRGWRMSSYLAAGGALVVLGLTGGRTAILFGLLIVLSWLLWRWLEKRVSGAVVILLGGLALGAVVSFLVVDFGGGSLWQTAMVEFRADSLRGRGAMYRASLDYLMRQPFLGLATQELASQAGSTYLRLGTHSEPLNVVFRFGIVGLAVFLATGAVFSVGYLQILRRLRSQTDSQEKVDVVVLLGIGIGAMVVNSLAHALQWDANVYSISWMLPGLVHGIGGSTMTKGAE